MGVKLKDINKEIGTSLDPEGWNEIHDKVIGSYDEMLAKKGYCNWGIGICVGEVVDAIVRNTGICITVSAFVKVNEHFQTKFVNAARTVSQTFGACPEFLQKLRLLEPTIYLSHPRAPLRHFSTSGVQLQHGGRSTPKLSDFSWDKVSELKISPAFSFLYNFIVSI